MEQQYQKEINAYLEEQQKFRAEHELWLRINKQPVITNSNQLIAEEEEKPATIPAKTKSLPFHEIISRKQKIGAKIFQNVFDKKK